MNSNDSRIGALSNGKICVSEGGKINCNRSLSGRKLYFNPDPYPHEYRLTFESRRNKFFYHTKTCPPGAIHVSTEYKEYCADTPKLMYVCFNHQYRYETLCKVKNELLGSFIQ